MKQTIQELLEKTACQKIQFQPAIRTTRPPAPPLWIDAITRAKNGSFIIHVSNRKDKAVLNLDMLKAHELNLLHQRLTVDTLNVDTLKTKS